MVFNAKFLPTIGYLNQVFGSPDSNIIVYSNKKLVVNADNYVVNGQEAFNFTIPDLIGNSIFNKIEESDIPFTDVIPDVQYEVKDKKELSKKVKTTSINSVLSFNTNTSLVEYAGAINHTDTSLATYPTIEHSTNLSPVDNYTSVWVGCLKARDFRLRVKSSPEYKYIDDDNEKIWGFVETNVALQEYAIKSFNNTVTNTQQIELYNFDSGVDLSVQELFLSAGTVPALGTTPGDLILYAGPFFDKKGSAYSSIKFPQDSSFVISDFSLSSDIVII